MNYGGNMPDWHQYNSLQGSRNPSVSQQNAPGQHIFIPGISPPTIDGINLSTTSDRSRKNDYGAARNYPPGISHPSVVHPVGHYSNNPRNSMIEADPRISINEEHRNGQMAFVPPSSNNLGVNGPSQNSPIGSMSPGRGQSYPVCKAPCCNPEIPNYWEKYYHNPGSVSYRDNLRGNYPTGSLDNRRFIPEMAARKDCMDGKDITDNPYPDHRRNFPDYAKYARKESVLTRNYQNPSSNQNSLVHQNYPMQSYNFPASGDYQKCPYTGKEYLRRGNGAAAMNQKNSMIKYPQEQSSVIVQQKYNQHSKPIQQYQNGGNSLPAVLTPGSAAVSVNNPQNSYFNPPRDYSRDYQNSDQSQVSTNRMAQASTNSHVHGSFQKYHVYHQKIAMQRFSVENHLRAFSRIPGYQTHPKYQECVMRYRELLRLQQNVDYQNVIQESPKIPSPATTSGNVAAPINLQFDQNGVLINSNYMPYPTELPVSGATEMVESDQRNENFETQNFADQNSRQINHDSSGDPMQARYFVDNEKKDGGYEDEGGGREKSPRIETVIDMTKSADYKNSKDFADKPELDVRQFLANWDESEDEETANNSAAATEVTSEQFPEVETTINTEKSPENCENPPVAINEDLPETIKTVNEQPEVTPKSIDCVVADAGIDDIPTIHIVENLDESGSEIEKIHKVFGSLATAVLNPDSSIDESNRTIVLFEQDGISSKSLEFDLQTEENGVIASIIESTEKSKENEKIENSTNEEKPPETPTKTTTASVISGGKIDPKNLRKQSSFTSDESHNPDDISLPDLQTSECTPISTTLNTPIQSDSEESIEQQDLTISTNPIEIIQNSPIISFTHSPIKIEPYEQLRGSQIVTGNSANSTNVRDSLDFDFDEEVASNENRKYNETCDSSPASEVEELENQANLYEQSISRKNELKETEANFYRADPLVGMTSPSSKEIAKISEEESENPVCEENPHENSEENPENDDFNRSDDLEKLCDMSLDASCMIPLIPTADESDEPRMPVSPMEGNCLTKILNDTLPITDLDMLNSSDNEKNPPEDDIWGQVENIETENFQFTECAKNKEEPEKIATPSKEAPDNFDQSQERNLSEVMLNDEESTMKPEMIVSRKISRQENSRINDEENRMENKHAETNLEIQVANLNHESMGEGVDAIEIKINLSRSDLSRRMSKCLSDKFLDDEETAARRRKKRKSGKIRCRRRRKSMPEMIDDHETKRSRKNDLGDDNFVAKKIHKNQRSILLGKIRKSMDDELLRRENESPMDENFSKEMSKNFQREIDDEFRKQFSDKFVNKIIDEEDEKKMPREISHRQPSPSYNFENSSTMDFDNFDVAPNRNSDSEKSHFRSNSDVDSIDGSINNDNIDSSINNDNIGRSINNDNNGRSINNEKSVNREKYKRKSSNIFDERTSRDAFEINLNTVPIYTTKDGRINYSPNRNYTYRTLIIEAKQRERRFSNNQKSNNRKKSSRTTSNNADSRRMYKRQIDEMKNRERTSKRSVEKSVSSRTKINENRRIVEKRASPEFDNYQNVGKEEISKNTKNFTDPGKVIEDRDDLSRNHQIFENCSLNEEIADKSTLKKFSAENRELENCSKIFLGRDLEISTRETSDKEIQGEEKSRFFEDSPKFAPMASPMNFGVEKKSIIWDTDCQTVLSDSGLESSTTYVEARKESRKLQKWKNSFVDRVEKSLYSASNEKCEKNSISSRSNFPMTKTRKIEETRKSFEETTRSTNIFPNENSETSKFVKSLDLATTNDKKKISEILEKSAIDRIDESLEFRLSTEIVDSRETNDTFFQIPTLPEKIAKNRDDETSPPIELENPTISENSYFKDYLVDSCASFSNCVRLPETALPTESEASRLEDDSTRFAPEFMDFHENAEKFKIPKIFENLQNSEKSKNFEDPKNFEISKNCEKSKVFENLQNSEKSKNVDNLQNCEKSKNLENPKNFKLTKKFEISKNFESSENFQISKNSEESRHFQNSIKSKSWKNGENSKDFENSKTLENSKTFDNAESFENSITFDNSKNFENTNISEESKHFKNSKKCKSWRNFENSKDLEILKNFEYSKNFENSKNVDDSVNFENSITFDNSKNFEITKTFDGSENFENSENYDFSSPANRSIVISMGNEDTENAMNATSDDYSGRSNDSRRSGESPKAPILTFSGQIRSNNESPIDSASKSPPDLMAESYIPLIVENDEKMTKEESHPKIPKMIIRNFRSRPGTPTLDETEKFGIEKMSSKFEAEDKKMDSTESKIPKMKIKLEESNSLIIESSDKTDDSSRNVPRVKIKKMSKSSRSPTSEKFPLVGKLSRQSSESDDINENSENNSYKFTMLGKSKNHRNRSESRDKCHEEVRVPKLTIKKPIDKSVTDNYSSSQSSIVKKRISSSPGESKKHRRGTSSGKQSSTKKEEPRSRSGIFLDDGNNDSHQSISGEKVPKVIIKRTSPSAEFKCELSKDDRDAIIKDSKWQPEVKLRRLWVLDYMAKEPGNGQVALKVLESTMNDSDKESTTENSNRKRNFTDSRGKSNDVKVRRKSNCDFTEKSVDIVDIKKNRRKSLDSIDYIDSDSIAKPEVFEFPARLRGEKCQRETKMAETMIDGTLKKCAGISHDTGNSLIKLDSSDESQTTIELLPVSLDNSQNGVDVGNDYFSCDNANVNLGKLYSDDAIPTQFELELEIVDNSNIDTIEVSTSFQESSHEKNSTMENRKNRENEFSVGQNLCCSDSLVKEVLAAKETLKRCLMSRSKNFLDKIDKSKPRTKTAAEKKQGVAGYDYPIKNSKSQESKISSSRDEDFPEKSRVKDHAGSEKKIKDSGDRSRSEKSHKSSDEKKSSWVSDKRQSGNSKDVSTSQNSPKSSSGSRKIEKKLKEKSKERIGENSRSSLKISTDRSKSIENSKFGEKSTSLDGKSYRIPKISRSRDKSENVIEETRKSPSPAKMPILEPQIDLNFEIAQISDRDTSRSPPVITKQEEIDRHGPKKMEENSEKLESIEKKRDEAVTFADIVSQLAYHEKATIRHRRYCTLCERWFPTAARHRRHLTGYQHRHTELTQRRTVHALFMLFTGKPCPRLLPASIVRTDCLPGEPTPLQIAVQDVAVNLDDVSRGKPSKDQSEKKDYREES